MPDERPGADVIAEVRLAAERATPGPWRLEHDQMPDGAPIWHIRIKRSIGSYSVISRPTSWCLEEQRADDAEYMATADPTTILRLCDEIERLEREVNGWRRLATGMTRIADRAWRGYMPVKGDE